MDRKIPHVLGHEVAGMVVETDVPGFLVGERVFAHHHAPCLVCDSCRRGAYVHCAQWRRTRLVPGGMAEFYAVGAENLTDTFVTDLGPAEAALIEPLACVAKSLRRARVIGEDSVGVIGLGAMGLMHLLVSPSAVGYDVNPARIAWAQQLGLDSRSSEAEGEHDVVVVCPGTPRAILEGARRLRAQGRLVLFAPIGPPGVMEIPLDEFYFRDLGLVTSYSCSVEDTVAAAEWLAQGRVTADQVVSHRIEIDELPEAYRAMKAGDILKPMVFFK